jgi:O-antigen/teichoic acid export membrane protein
MKVITNSIIYFGVGGLQSFMSFLLLPLYTSYLGAYEFGLVNVVNSVAGLLGLIYIFGATGVISRFYFEYKDDSDKLKTFLSTIFMSKIIINSLLTFVLILGRSVIFPFLAEGVSFFPYLLIATGIGFFSTFFLFFQILHQTKQAGVKYAIFQIVYLLLNNGLSVLFLVVFDMKAVGIILGTLLSHIIMDTVLFITFRKSFRLKIDKEMLKETSRYALPIAIHAIFTWGLAAVNNLLLNNKASTSDVGIYSIGFVIGSIVSTVAVAINRSYTPWFYEQMKKQKEDNSDVVKFGEFIILIYSILAVFLSLFAPEVIELFVDTEFDRAWIVVPIVAFAYVFNGVYFFFVNIFNYNRKFVKFVPLYSLLAAIINIVLNLVLIPPFGIIGSAFATLVSMIVLSLSTYIGSRKFAKVKFNYYRIIYLIGLPAIFSLFVYVKFDFSLLVTLGIKIIYAIIVLAILYLLHKRLFKENIDKQLFKLKRLLNGFKGNNRRVK